MYYVVGLMGSDIFLILPPWFFKGLVLLYGTHSVISPLRLHCQLPRPASEYVAALLK